jgi:S-DNA-T family DNA segregation ATPase FtsK/SpoIIIE
MRDDESVIIADTPIESSDEREEVPLQRTYDPIPSLRKQFEQDALVPEFEIAPAPVRSQKVKTEDPVPPQKSPVQAAPVMKEEPKATEAPPAVEEDSPDEDPSDDMDTVSGVGGLISSNAGSSALLTRDKTRYNWPPEDLLDTYPDHVTEIDEITRLAGENLINTLKQFKIEAELMNIVKGPTVTMFEVSPAPGVRVSSIISLSDNIALQLAARQVRIVAPIPGKQAVGIEVPNHDRSIIGFKDLLPTIDAKSYQVPMILGRKITGEPVVIELTQTPHLLIAGATGSGKSVCVNSLISSLLYRRSPKDVRLILVDPKIVELRVYNGIPHLLTPVITEPKKTIKALEFCLYEMDRRYKLLNALAVRNIAAYNRKIQEMKLARERLPFIVVVIDEFADLMTTVGKELETLLARLAAMARAVGIHLVLATQRPSANVITGIIKSNIPTRIAFMVASQIDSRIIIDETGAEKLLGRGDMLFAPGWDPHSVRIQGAFLSDEEVERIVAFAKTQGEPDYLDEAFFEDDTSSSDTDDDDDSDDSSDDVLMEKALKIVVERQSASASYLQRRLKIGYNRAARLVEQMEDDGYVGPARGSKPRELLRYPE